MGKICPEVSVSCILLIIIHQYIKMSNLILFLVSGVLCILLFSATPVSIYYPVTSSTEKGILYSEKFSIRYYCNEVWTVLGTDIWRGAGQFVCPQSIVKINQSTPIPDSIIEENELSPAFTWWQKYGKWVLLSIIPLFFLSRKLVFKYYNTGNARKLFYYFIILLFLAAGIFEFWKRGLISFKPATILAFTLWTSIAFFLALKVKSQTERELTTLLYKFSRYKMPRRRKNKKRNINTYVFLFINILFLIFYFYLSRDIRSVYFIAGYQSFIFFFVNYLV